MQRRTICLPRPGTHSVLQHGDPEFQPHLDRLYPPAESTALEALIALKARLIGLTGDEFWTAATEGMSALLGAEMTFVMKRVLVDDHDSAVEMPPHGEPGACMMAAAFHYCTMDGTKQTIKQTKFHAWGCPCAYMRHDKVFLIPEDLPGFIPDNPNPLPKPAEAYMAVPLFAEGKCLAHFGAMWSKENALDRKLSWAFIELVLHSLEDMMLERLLQGTNFIKPSTHISDRPRVIIPHEAVTLAQSLRPYAPSLSHELRTPMQGVVGMLDVMYATVQDAVETQSDPHLRQLFQNLKESIEVVQDSSRRAVEAADNFVHAADMDLTVPEPAPSLILDDATDALSPWSTTQERRPEILVAGSNLPLSRPNKRRREEPTSSRSGSNASASVKMARVEGASSVWSKNSELSHDVIEGLQEAEQLQKAAPEISRAEAASLENGEATARMADSNNRIIAPGLRHTNMREMFQYVISEGLKMGGRPDSVTTQETEDGEIIEVRSYGSDGASATKTIEWSVDPSVPHTIFVDEKDLTKLISCVFLNAVKFTDQNSGRILCSARMTRRYISIRIADNGPGIPAAFLPKLFKPFTQENGSITRASEGLGLGLMVAKGIARKLGGDLLCTRAETEGPEHGSEFDVRIPLIAGETISRPTSPFGSPMPRRAQVHHPTDLYSTSPPVPPLPPSPRRLSKALQDVRTSNPYGSDTSDPSRTSPPESHTSEMLDVAGPPAIESRERTATPPDQPLLAGPNPPTVSRPKMRKAVTNSEVDRELASKYPLTFLVCEDNRINRRLLVSMLAKLGYKNVYEAHDGVEGVRQMEHNRAAVVSKQNPNVRPIDVVLMDLWMPLMDGYEATEKILQMHPAPTVLAVTADVTDGALERAAQVGMTGFMTKPYKMMDLQRLITEYCVRSQVECEVPRGLPRGLGGG